MGDDPEFVDDMMIVGTVTGIPGKLTWLLNSLEHDPNKDKLTRINDIWMRIGVLLSVPLDRFGQYDWSIGAGKVLMGVPIQLYTILEILKKDKQEAAEREAKKAAQADEPPKSA